MCETALWSEEAGELTAGSCTARGSRSAAGPCTEREGNCAVGTCTAREGSCAVGPHTKRVGKLGAALCTEDEGELTAGRCGTTEPVRGGTVHGTGGSYVACTSTGLEGNWALKPHSKRAGKCAAAPCTGREVESTAVPST